MRFHSSPSWFVKKYGHRLVSVVVSPSPNIENKAVQVMCVRSFFSDFLLLHGDRFYWTIKEALSLKTACLHQSGIMDQIPELYEFVQPAATFLGTQVQVKIDLGIRSAGSRTQLSLESRNVVFVQIVGVNYLRLYDNEESHKLYLYTSRESYMVSENSYSAVSCEDEDFDLHPLAKDASYHDTYLFPGDALFVPSNTFFYIRSICASIHVDYKW
jgi:Cupin-like domain